MESPHYILNFWLCRFFFFSFNLFQSEAQTLEMAKMSKFGGGIGAPTREEHLKESAKIHMQLGNIQRYCEVLVELGQVLKLASDFRYY